MAELVNVIRLPPGILQKYVVIECFSLFDHSHSVENKDVVELLETSEHYVVQIKVEASKFV